MSEATGTRGAAAAAAGLVLPLALAQFIASYAGTNMNVAITTIAEDIGTTVPGIQTAITLFTLTMAALMIPGSKLTDIWGRKRCFLIGLAVYGAGALLASAAQGLGLILLGYSLLQGVGSALMIPPIYILITVAFDDVASRARNFGIVSGAAGLGAAAGPLIGGVVTSAISWRASFVLQFLVVAVIFWISFRITMPATVATPPRFDLGGAVLSALGLFLVVFGVLMTSTYGWTTSRQALEIGDTVVIPEGGVSPVWLLIAAGALVLLWFVRHVAARERSGRDPLLQLRLFRNRTSNLGLVTQNVQWLVLQGSFFVVSVFIQQIRGYSAIETGLILTPATMGILLSSAVAGRMARRRPQATLVRAGFVATTTGMVLVLALVRETSAVWTFVPGLLLMGVGIGVMLTASVNVVQSSFGDNDQGEISGLSRSVSNLGSSLGVALAGSVLVAAARPGGGPFAIAMVVLSVLSLGGLVAALLLRKVPVAPTGSTGS